MLDFVVSPRAPEVDDGALPALTAKTPPFLGVLTSFIAAVVGEFRAVVGRLSGGSGRLWAVAGRFRDVGTRQMDTSDAFSTDKRVRNCRTSRHDLRPSNNMPARRGRRIADADRPPS